MRSGNSFFPQTAFSVFSDHVKRSGRGEHVYWPKNGHFQIKVGSDIANSSSPKPGGQTGASPGLFRRLAAISYDALLLVAVWFTATAALLPFNAGEAFTSGQYFFPIYLLFVSFLFFSWFWTHGGQTLGLRAWKMKVLTLDQEQISWKQAMLRFLGALVSWSLLGLGFLWIVKSQNNMAWHDSLSGTTLFFEDR